MAGLTPTICPLCGQRAELNGAQAILERNMLVLDGEAISLAPKQAEIAAALVEASGRPISTDALMAHLYGLEADWPGDETIRTHVSHLRRAIQKTEWTIFHVSSRGYRLVRNGLNATLAA